MATTKNSKGRIRTFYDPNYKGNLAQELQAHLNQRSLNAAFRAYAEAMWSAQNLEVGLALLLLDVKHERTTEKTIDELHDLHGYLFTRTLGNLIKRLKDEDVPVPPQLEADLTKALELRNLIAHRYFYERKRLAKWFLNSGLKDLTRELKEIRMTFDLVSQEITRLTESVCKKAKGSEEEAKQFMEQEFLPALAKVHALYKLNRRRRKSSTGKQGTARKRDENETR